MIEEQILTNLLTELRRGTLTLCVLSQLKTPQYGYALLQRLSENHIDIEANTLYPLLRRLESQGMLASNWDTTESRPRKFYYLSEGGVTLYTSLKQEYLRSSKHINQIIGEEQHA